MTGEELDKGIANSRVEKSGLGSSFRRWFNNLRKTSHVHQESEYPDILNLKDYLLEAAKSPKLALGTVPQGFELGEFGKEAERLLRLTLADPDQPEYGSAAYLNRNGRIVILTNPIRGEKGSVRLPIFSDKQLILGIHSHGDKDTPFSPSDIKFLIEAIDARPGRSQVGSFVITPSIKIFAIRSTMTPQYDKPMAFWETESHPEMMDLNEGNLELPEEKGILIKNISEGSHRRMFALSRMFQEFNINVYACDVSKNTAVLIQ